LIVKMVDICSKIGSGATPRGGKEAYCEDGVSLIRSQNVLDFEFSESGLAHINNDQAQKLKNVEVRADDVLLNITGDSVARACMIEETFLPARVNQHVAIIRGERNRVLGSYLLYFLQLRKEHLLQLASAGATRNALTKGMIEQLELDLPTVSIQRKIVSVLDLIMKKIALNREINDNLQQQLHMFYTKMFAESAMDAVLGDVVVTASGGTPSRKHSEYYNHGNICWVKSKELFGDYLHDTEEYINELAIAKSSAKLLPSHSVLIAMYGATVGAYGIISHPMTCNQAVCALLSTEKYPYTYLFQIACESQQKLINLAVGSAQQNISQVLIKQLPIHSNEDIIQEFHSLARPIHEKLETLQAENRQLSEMRDSLLPKLMSGELDVSSIDL
jgi:type I restriction enzyme S subunit